MKCSIFVALALSVAVSAIPVKGGGKGAAAKAAQAKGKAGKGTAAKGAAAVAAPPAAAAAAAAAPAASAAAAAVNTASSATVGAKDIQNSLSLDKSVIATGFANNGQAVAEPGQVASLTSNNNFINFCATAPQLPITNGKQITSGSCNPAPMGAIPSVTNMPSAKFQFPTNGGTIAANVPFNISMAISNLETGNFVNAQQNYFAAPQQLNAGGQIIGHSHVVVEALASLGQTTPTDPTKFAFFKGLNNAAVGGLLSAEVPTGLPAGTYKVSSINTAANHQPALVPVAQHGSLDDVVYFTVSASAAGAAAAPPAAAAAAPAAAAAKGAAATAAKGAAAKGAAAKGSAAKGAAATAAKGAAAKGAAAKGAAAKGAAAKKGKGKRMALSRM